MYFILLVYLLLLWCFLGQALFLNNVRLLFAFLVEYPAFSHYSRPVFHRLRSRIIQLFMAYLFLPHFFLVIVCNWCIGFCFYLFFVISEFSDIETIPMNHSMNTMIFRICTFKYKVLIGAQSYAKILQRSHQYISLTGVNIDHVRCCLSCTHSFIHVHI